MFILYVFIFVCVFYFVIWQFLVVLRCCLYDFVCFDDIFEGLSVERKVLKLWISVMTKQGNGWQAVAVCHKFPKGWSRFFW